MFIKRWWIDGRTEEGCTAIYDNGGGCAALEVGSGGYDGVEGSESEKEKGGR